MSEMERQIFAAAYALELGKRVDAAVTSDDENGNRAIAYAHWAVALYRKQRLESDP